jgi:hypothetical protein
MTKYILLESTVPTTWDGGFRADGYKVIDSIELDEKLDIPQNVLDGLIAKGKTMKPCPQIWSGIPARKEMKKTHETSKKGESP